MAQTLQSHAQTLQVADGGLLDPPARRLEQELERALSGAGEPRGSARRSLGFALATHGAFWLMLVWGLRAALS